MASSRILTVPVRDAGSESSVPKVDSPVSISSWEKISASPNSPSSDGSSDLSYWFRLMGLPNPQSWAHKFHNAGYGDMDEVSAADFDVVFFELKVPSGIQNKLRTGIQQFGDGTLGENSMPDGDLDATAPVQTVPTKGINWWFWGGVALTVAAVADCLDGETLVTMADRSKKKIKDVKIGDKILSYNKGKLRVRMVVEVKDGSSNTMRELFLQDGKGPTSRYIKATAGHPFYTKEKQWAVISPDDAHFDASKPVKKLTVGDTLVLRSGGAKLVKIGEKLPKQKTYNLVIDGPGTFFVEGILSHSGLPPLKK